VDRITRGGTSITHVKVRRVKMKAKQSAIWTLALAMFMAPGAAIGQPYAVGTAFTYQGQLKEGGVPVTTPVDLEFTLWSDPVSTLPADQIGGVHPISLTPDANGLFTVVLNDTDQFTTSPFNGQARWLQIAVSPAGVPPLSTLWPRQELTPAPHALALPGLYTQQNATSPNLIGGFSGNTVDPVAVGVSIAGGGQNGSENLAFDDFGSIGGGVLNVTGSDDGQPQQPDNAPYATVAGGTGNRANGNASAVSGGNSNVANGDTSVIAGGLNNQAAGNLSFVGGGAYNVASGLRSTVVGGSGNSASAARATVIGGGANVAGGESSTVAGGFLNTAAGDYSFAAGQRAQANDAGSFVWSDTTTVEPEFFATTGPDQFLIQAAGGVAINTPDPSGYALNVAGTVNATDLLINGSPIAGGTGDGHSLDAADGDPVDAVYVDNEGKVGVGTTTPVSALNVAVSGQAGWNSGNGWGDFSVSDGTVGLAIGVGDGATFVSDCCSAHAYPGCDNADCADAVCVVLPVCCAEWTQDCADLALSECSGACPAAGDARVWVSGGTERLAFGNPTDGELLVIDDNLVDVPGTLNAQSVTTGFIDVDGTATVTGLQLTTGVSNGYVLTSDPNGVGTWQPVDLGTGNTLDEAYDGGGAGLGRTITADAGPVEILGPDGLEVAGTIKSGNSITIDGTADTISSNGDLELHVLAGRALRIETTAKNYPPNLIGGSDWNSVTAGVVGAVVSGGGLGGFPNRVTDSYGGIGGGYSNQAGDDTGTTDDAGKSWVGGGQGNKAEGALSTIGGGFLNRTTNPGSTIGGGDTNFAAGYYSTVPGGKDNTVLGHYGFAAGRRAKANNDGTFVWADSTDADFTSTGTDQFLIRATGGVGIGTATPGAQLEVEDAIRASRPGAPTQYLEAASPGPQGLFLTARTAESNKKPLIIQNVHNGAGSPSGNSEIIFRTGNDLTSSYTEVMRLTEAGNVGIGTSSPDQVLQVNGPGDSGPFTDTDWQADFGKGGAGRVVVGSYEDQPAIQGHGTGTSFRLLLNPTGGNVGIGTTGPLHKLVAIHDEPGKTAIYGLHTAAVDDTPGVFGKHDITDYYGVGVGGVGGYIGVQGSVAATGSNTYYGVTGYADGGSGTNMGVYGSASGSGTNYGVYGSASGGTTNYAGYFDGPVRVDVLEITGADLAEKFPVSEQGQARHGDGDRPGASG
jgi:hypothetical protein